MHSIFVLYDSGLIAVLLLILLSLLVNMLFIPAVKEGKNFLPKGRNSIGEGITSEVQPLLSVLIPARNESYRIRPCLASLLNQDYKNFELIVLDDSSEDDTAKIVAAYAQINCRLSLISGQPLPDGWTGKSWACHQLSSRARGDLLLFTDADTIHSPGTLAAAVQRLQLSRADLLTIWPYQVTGTLSEKLVIPLLFVVAGSLLPHWLLALCQRSPRFASRLSRKWLASLGAANGQFLLFTRTSYFRIGGHRAVRDHLVEDVALARLVAEQTAQGMRLINCDGTRLIKCRMYRSFGQMWEGFTKNVRPVFEGNTFGFLVAILLQAIVFVFPFLAVALRPGPATSCEIAILYAIRIAAALRYGTSWLSVILHPIGYALALIIALNSLRQTSGHGVTWKGRLYHLAGKGQRTAEPKSSIITN
ncbi:MAG: glycosyltransferase [Verrucomicrobia bacterium]|nr:glycosyltransferase [Verrucomicrobiota bacterium]